MMERILYVLLLTFYWNFTIAQKLTGRIIDANNLPIADAFVYTNTDNFSLSNERGQFQLKNVKANETLTISFLGFKTLEYIIQQKDFQEGVKLILEKDAFDLEQVNVSNNLKAINSVTSIDLVLNPVNSSQDILRKVPGLLIGQHAGGGKAEQIFLRGFDIDHGTDINITVDGLPVNMVSHAHGQGYADLHFLIPETIDKIDFGKGPYYAEQGNFTTAGYVNFKTKEKLDQSSIGIEYGQFNTVRTFGLIDLLGNSERQHAYVATEFLLSDGPFESSQDFNRLNIMGKYTLNLENEDKLSVQLSQFQSKWTASGQIPQRLVDNGRITRFGSVDDTEGGNTSRTNVALDYIKVLDQNRFLKTNLFYSQYDFELFSNFTFFLEDPINGDQIRQRENRTIYGFNSTLFQNTNIKDFDVELKYGIGFRYDDINDNELARTANRAETLEQLAYGDIDEVNFYSFVDAAIDLGKWRINPSIRLDIFDFAYVDKLQSTFSPSSETGVIASPKLNISYNPNRNWQLFLKSGIGFHSNDTRVVVTEAADLTLPKAYGVDFGTIWRPQSKLWVNAALWYLFLEQEFVYVGDAGIVEPSGRTERQGIDVGLRYQLTKNLFLNADINYTYARSIDDEVGQNYIPLAPDLTSVGGLTYQSNGFSGSLRYRYIKNRPANEDNSIIAEGYFITDLNANYNFDQFSIGFTIENLFNQEWNEAQFATESRLQNESEPVEELHFTPGVPFFINGRVTYNF